MQMLEIKFYRINTMHYHGFVLHASEVIILILNDVKLAIVYQLIKNIKKIDGGRRALRVVNVRSGKKERREGQKNKKRKKKSV